MKSTTFGNQLRAARTEAGIGLRVAARAAGVSPGYLSLVETGKEPPPRHDTLGRILEAIGASPDDRRLLATAAAQGRGWVLEAGLSADHDALAAKLLARWSTLSPSEIRYLVTSFSGT